MGLLAIWMAPYKLSTVIWTDLTNFVKKEIMDFPPNYASFEWRPYFAILISINPIIPWSLLFRDVVASSVWWTQLWDKNSSGISQL